MKLCYLALEAPREGTASYTHVFEIIAGLRTRGWHVDVICPSSGEGWDRPNLFRRILEYLAMQLRLAGRIRRYDLIYVRSHFLALPIAIMARLAGVKIVHEINGPYEDVFVSHPMALPFRSMLETIQRIQYRLSDGLTAVTMGLRDWAARESGGHDVRVIPNAANTMLFNGRAKPADGLPDRYVVFFGGLAKWHGVGTMIEALGRPEWPVGVHLVIVGDGMGASKIAEAADQLPQLVWLGRRRYREMPSIIVGAFAGLIPITDPLGRSRTGLAPLKMFEALACGVPVIVSDFPGQADFVRANDCGLVFPPDDPAGLANAVATLAVNPVAARQMGRRGLERVCLEHSWDRRAAELHRYLCQIIDPVGEGMDATV